jgi:Transposase DDE domain
VGGSPTCPNSRLPARAFAALYHQRWRIEEAFRRLNSRMKLESVSGLSHHPLLTEVAAKMLADKLASLLCAAARRQGDAGAANARSADAPDTDADGVADLPSADITGTRRSNRTCAAEPTAAVLAVDRGRLPRRADPARALLGPRHTALCRRATQPRPSRHIKPHPSMAYKG